VWSFALHSFHSALGEVEMPFFGASQKQKRREGKKNAILRSAAWRISPVPCLGRGAGSRGGSAQK
jgi:hypothetical protein